MRSVVLLLAMFCTMTAAAQNAPVVTPIPPPAQLTPVERLHVEAQRRTIDQSLQQQSRQVPMDAAQLRTLNSLRSARQRLDQMLER